MATKKQTMEDAANGEGCLGKAADDEPVFVLRGRDTLAPSLVDNWANLALKGVSPHDASPKVIEARKVAEAMRAWQGKNGRKFPD